MKLGLLLFFLLCQQRLLWASENLQILTTEYPPFQMKSADGVVGISVDLVREILKAAQMQGDIVVVPWARADLELKNNKRSVLFFSLTRTPERETWYQWIADITPNQNYLWKLKKNENIKIKSIENLRQYRIGSMEGVATELYLIKKGIPKDRFVHVSRDEQLVAMLDKNRVDLIALDEMAFWKLVQLGNFRPDKFESAFPLSDTSGHSYLVANLATPAEVVTRLQKAWTAVKMKKKAK